MVKLKKWHKIKGEVTCRVYKYESNECQLLQHKYMSLTGYKVDWVLGFCCSCLCLVSC